MIDKGIVEVSSGDHHVHTDSHHYYINFYISAQQ